MRRPLLGILLPLVWIAACAAPPTPAPTADATTSDTTPPSPREAELVVSASGTLDVFIGYGRRAILVIQPDEASASPEPVWTVAPGERIDLGLSWDDTDRHLIVGGPVGNVPRRIAPGRYRIAAVAELTSDDGSFLLPGDSERVVPDCVIPLVVTNDTDRVRATIDFGAAPGEACDLSVATE